MKSFYSRDLLPKRWMDHLNSWSNFNLRYVHQIFFFHFWAKSVRLLERKCGIFYMISLHIHSMWETTVMHKQVSGCTVNFGPNFPESPFLESQTRKPPPFGKLQIWDDQSLLHNTPPFQKTSNLGWPKFTPEYPPFRKTSDLGWPKFTPEYPTFWKTSDLGWPKFTPEYPPPHFGKLQIWDDQSLLRNTPPFGKLQIWDDQSLLWNTPRPISKNFRFGMTKVYSGIPPPPESLRMPRVTTCGDFIQPG